MSGQCHNHYKILNRQDIGETSTDYSLGLHLVHEYDCSNKEGFNKHFQVQLVENYDPASLKKIFKYMTWHPLGLNKNNPLGHSILH